MPPHIHRTKSTVLGKFPHPKRAKLRYDKLHLKAVCTLPVFLYTNVNVVVMDLVFKSKVAVGIQSLSRITVPKVAQSITFVAIRNLNIHLPD